MFMLCVVCVCEAFCVEGNFLCVFLVCYFLFFVV